MTYLIINGNPKKTGLCKSVMDEILRGATDGGAQAQVLQIGNMPRCRCCGDGWGICFEQHICAFGGDGFNEAQSAVKSADMLCIITPVYWSDMSEQLKAFLDRLRRCENFLNRYRGALSGKPVLLAASAGGSGGGILPCLNQMESFCRQTGALVFDHIGVHRWNHDYMRAAAYAAAKAMAEGRKVWETI